MELKIIGMDNNNNSLSQFEDDENKFFDETIAIYNNIVSANMKLISQQEQIQKNIKVASVMILCIVVFGLHFLRMLSDTTNSIIEFEPQKEWRRQELMEYLVHIERFRDIICMDHKHSFNYVNELGKLDLLRMHIDKPWKNNLLNFSTLLNIM